MFEKETDFPAKPKDRKLGDEWLNWSGDTNSTEPEINENLTTFFTLAAGIIFIFIALLPVAWYLIKPRIEQFHPFAPDFIKWSVMGFAVILLVLFLTEIIWLMKFRKSLFSYRWIEKFLLFLLPKTVWLGAKFGISRDRVGNSFIKVHNFITKTHMDNLNPDRFLILLPRCLKKEVRNQTINRINENLFKTLTVGGGEEARKAIREFQPSIILAIACERDLMGGIKDIAEKIPVLAISNKRPEGPCKNTHFHFGELEEALSFIT
ncbi:MAG: DUF116 domain-containing protein [Candidatus Mariimomonas ferrooxydans]